MSKKKKHIQTEKDFIGKRLPAIVFPFGAVFYALGVRLLLREKGGSFVKRLLRIWVPLFAWCAIVRVCHSGRNEVKRRIFKFYAQLQKISSLYGV